VTFMDGTLATPYRVPLARVTGTDLLSAESGNLFLETIDSGGLMLGFPEDPGFGTLQSGGA
jgi:flagellar hook protein FlgE